MNAYDAIIIGSGQAGPFLAGRLTEAGMRVALIERHPARGLKPRITAQRGGGSPSVIRPRRVSAGRW